MEVIPYTGWDITNCDICRNEEFEELLSSIHYTLLNPDHDDDDIIEITPLKIVSVVVCAELKDTVIDLGLLFGALKQLGENVFYQEHRPPTKSKSKKNKGVSRMFYNCMVWKIQCRDGEGDKALMNVSVKCFPNGKFQYAGFNTMHAIQLVTRIVTSKIRKVKGAMTPNTQKIEDPRVIQINSTFYILKDKNKYQIKQIVLNNILGTEESESKGGKIISSSFMPEKYPGINAKFRCVPNDSKKNQITLLIFATGAVLINGHNDIEQYREAYYMLCNVIHRHRARLLAPNLLGN